MNHTAAELLASARATVQAMASVARPSFVARVDGLTVQRRWVQWSKGRKAPRLSPWDSETYETKMQMLSALRRAGFVPVNSLAGVWIKRQG
jgi:hypothetical protein